MVFVLLIPVILSLLLLAAHMMYHFGLVPALLALLPTLLLLIPRRAAALVVQVVLLLAALEWLRTAALAIDARQARGEDWRRYAVILGAVTVWTLLSMLVFRTKWMRRYYRGAAKQ